MATSLTMPSRENWDRLGAFLLQIAMWCKTLRHGRLSVFSRTVLLTGV